MLAQDGNGAADFEDGNEDGWPVGGGGGKDPSKTSINKKKHHTKRILTMRWEK